VAAVTQTTAERKAGSRRTATSNSVEVRATRKSIRSEESSPLHSGVDDVSSDEEEVSLPTTVKKQGCERLRFTSERRGEQSECR